MSHEKETKQTPAAETKAPETEAKAPEQEAPKAEKPEAKHEGKHHHETAALQAKLDEAEKKNEELKNQLLRTAAEYDNYRKRSQREADQKFNDGVPRCDPDFGHPGHAGYGCQHRLHRRELQEGRHDDAGQGRQGPGNAEHHRNRSAESAV